MNGRILTLAFIAVVAIGVAPAFAQGYAAKGATVFAAQKCSMCHSVVTLKYLARSLRKYTSYSCSFTDTFVQNGVRDRYRRE